MKGHAKTQSKVQEMNNRIRSIQSSQSPRGHFTSLQIPTSWPTPNEAITNIQALPDPKVLKHDETQWHTVESPYEVMYYLHMLNLYATIRDTSPNSNLQSSSAPHSRTISYPPIGTSRMPSSPPFELRATKLQPTFEHITGHQDKHITINFLYSTTIRNAASEPSQIPPEANI
jgi:hypothetical protein